MCPTAGGHHNHGHGGAMEVSEAKVEADQPLISGPNHEHGHEQLHACIGVSLVLGFVFMLLVDQIGSAHMHNTEGHSRPPSKPASTFSFYKTGIVQRG